MGRSVSEEAWPPLGGPFPHAPIADPLERRWLHYAFVARDGSRALVANVAWLGGDGGGHGLPSFRTAVLLAHDAEGGWSASQWNAAGPAEPWSSFRLAGPSAPDGAHDDRPPRFALAAAKGWPAADLRLRPTSTPGVSGCSTFGGGHWQRWQAEPGVLASGVLKTGEGEPRPFDAVGYHERVRGRWGWPEMGGWVFGFCNHTAPGDRDQGEGPPPWSVVFALLQPQGPGETGGIGPDGPTCALMLWRRGRMVRFIPRRNLRVTTAGQLARDRVSIHPWQSALLGTGPTAPIPAALCVDGFQGRDWIQLRFRSRTAARLVVPSETSLAPFSVHEVLGEAEVVLSLAGRRESFRSPAVVEFAGGAAEGAWDVD